MSREDVMEVSARMRGAPVVIPMSDVRPSVSRNDVMAEALLREGITAERVAQELRTSLTATTTVRRSVYVGRKYSHHEEVEVPDWKSRLKAVEVYLRVMGYEFQSEKVQDGVVSRDVLMVVKNLMINGKGVTEASVEELEAAHRRNIEAGLVVEVEDGEVTDAEAES
jgi:hypothetical protein